MCGIAGWVGYRKNGGDGLAEAMQGAISYRGRDGEGQWYIPGEVRLFHSRLSIVDLYGGAQPMADFSGRYRVVFNGEIYNFKELRREYEALGAVFQTQSDTEVILEGFRLKGAGVCADLNGMFAFALWDRQERRLFLARDRLGKKPLYWTTLGGAFFFSSSLNAFAQLPGWTGELSRLDLDAYAAIGDFRPGRTAFRQGRSLPAATYAFVDLDKDPMPRETTYWRLDFAEKFAGTFDEAVDAFEALISDAIAIRLRADVPLALTFSGGVDSGIIAAIAAKRLDNPLSCWTIDYHTDADPSEETLIAERVAAHLGLEWHYQHFDYHTDLIPSLRDTLGRVDQPCRHMAIGYSDRLYGAIRPQAKVVLSGNGADELFLGYSGNEALVTQEAKRQRGIFQRLLPKSMSGGLRSRQLADYQTAYVRANLGEYAGEDDPDEFVSQLHADISESGVRSFGDLYSFMALKYYTSDPNYRIPDIAGLGQQVEVRSPFLDSRVVEFAACLPMEFKIGDPADSTRNKRLLKEYYARHVPADIVWATKKGMGSNLRYDRSLAEDGDLLALYDRLLDRIEAAGLSAQTYRSAWQTYLADKRSGIQNSPAAGAMSTGLMLGLWLDVHHG